MLKIHALNRDSSSDEDAPGIRREAQVRNKLFLINLEVIYYHEISDFRRKLRLICTIMH